MKIRMMTFHTPKNYGAVLQAYSLFRYFEDQGYDTKVIDFSPDSLINRYRIVSKADSIKGIAKNIVAIPTYRPISVKFQKFNYFKEHKMNLTGRYTSYDALCQESWGRDEVFVTGSDQVFNPVRLSDEQKAFYLDFVPAENYKFSYAASFGERSIPEEKKKQICASLESFNRLSVREERGIENVHSVTDKCVVEVLDPVFLNTADFWSKVEKEYILPKQDYILYYRLMNRKDSDALAAEIQNKLGLKMLVVTQGLFKADGTSKVLYDVGPEELLYLFRNCKYAITDSFHGVAFSVIYNKQFTFVDKSPATNGRGLNLMTRIGIRNGEPVDYTAVNKKLGLLKEESIQYLESCLDEADKFIKDNTNRIESIGDRCTGCGACASFCPKKAITLRQNCEGFYYPMVDAEKCIKCGKCDRICHILNPEKCDNKNRSTFYGWSKDYDKRKASSSGGAFTAIAETIASDDGVIYGAYFDFDELRLKHGSTDTVPLDNLKKSKYLESYMGDSIARVKCDLDAGKKVLFCGTPCEVSGLKSAIKDDSNLVTVDFICHGVPSSKLFTEHLKNIIKGEKLLSLDFRPKDRGWTGKNLALRTRTRTRTRIRPFYADTFYYGFITKNAILRNSCYHCEFRQNHVADITVADFWQYSKVAGLKNDEKGISLIIANTEKGRKLIARLHDFELHEIDNSYSDYVYEPKDYSSGESLRTQFFKNYQQYGFEKAAKTTYMDDYAVRKIKAIVKEILGRR